MTLAAIIAGIVKSIITEFSKKYNIPTFTLLTILSIILAVGYELYKYYFNPMIQENILQFVLTAWASANIFYNTFIKIFNQAK